MKHVILSFVVFFSFALTVQSQVLEDKTKQSPQEVYDYHFSKMRSNKTAAWITLGGGVAMVVGGIVWNSSAFTIGPDSEDVTDGLWLSYLGGATALASIPLFIAAGKHKKKAEIQLKNGAVGLIKKIKYSGISFSVNF
ncbi:hypothetical protein [Aestuariivivens sediminis]|uniref:hypothetical protein n=1 Tax=Aestuariivivens sediminis TaxID=2913557 RepID=UPI001F5ABCE7|nr:hypothetical protein [Aestuariivivens sediminis]